MGAGEHGARGVDMAGPEMAGEHAGHAVGHQRGKGHDQHEERKHQGDRRQRRRTHEMAQEQRVGHADHPVQDHDENDRYRRPEIGHAQRGVQKAIGRCVRHLDTVNEFRGRWFGATVRRFSRRFQ